MITQLQKLWIFCCAYLLIKAHFFLDSHTTTDPVWSFWLESKISVYRQKSFSSKESNTKLLQSIYFAYEVGITSSY